jgi:protein-disulfide isomerase
MAALPPVTARDHVRGPAPGEEAAHTLLLYGDFACPLSRQVHLVVAQVLKAFPGRVRYVFRHFPLRTHAHALHAAEAAEAAAAQGAFWPMHDRLFQHQLALTDAELMAHAEALGLDAREVRTALREGVFREQVLGQKRAAVAAGVDSTLNLVVDGALFQEDDVEDAVVERVIRPLKAEGGL